jgi:hypothetical protein
LGQKDKKRQFALVKSGMAVFNITIGFLQIPLMPISLISPASHWRESLAKKERFVLLCNAKR